jgi:hypothetical protein
VKGVEKTSMIIKDLAWGLTWRGMQEVDDN